MQKKPNAKKNTKKQRPFPSGKKVAAPSESRPKTHVRIGMCTSDYVRALADPKDGPLSCVPTMPANFSRKIRVFQKGSFNVGTAGLGFVAMDPRRFIANDVTSVFSTDITFAGANMNFAAAAGIVAGTSNSEYTQAQIGPDDAQLMYKVVSAELRARYADTELNMGGQVVGFHDPNHSSLYQETFASVQAEEVAEKFAASRKNKRVLYKPVESGDTDWQSTLSTYTPATTDNSFYMGLLVAASNPTTWEWEAYVTFEVYGRNVRGMTPSHVDAVGFQAAHAITQLGTFLKPTEVGGSKLQDDAISSLLNYLVSQVTTVTPSTAPRGAVGDAAGVVGAAAGMAALLNFFI